jgi:hypothetical protein
MQRTAEALKTAAAKTGRGKRGSAEEEPAEAPEEAPQPPAKGRPPRRPPPAEEPGRVALAPPAEGTEGGAGARVFACNYYVDLNGNGNPDADEFSGVKAAFKKSERIILVVDMPDPRPGAAELRVRTWNPQGKMILDVAMPAAAVPKFYRIGDRESGGKQYDFMAWLMANGGHGTYKVACYVANELACSGEFQIVE